MDKWPPMAFQKREDWVAKKTPDCSLCRQFEVWCGVCGSFRVKAAVGYENGDFIAVLICQQCRIVAEIKMRSPIPKPFQARCLCKSSYVCPHGDAQVGRLDFTCLDCAKGEMVCVT